TFEFALVSGRGDWRETGMPSRSAEFNHPMVAVAADGGAGVLPPDGSLLTVEPAGAVQLAALKVGGNPTATGSSGAVDPEDVTIRLVETRGATTDLTISSPVGKIAGLVPADLLETARGGGQSPLRLHGYQIATLLAHLDVPTVLDADGSALAPDAEAAQPLYSRYWLHNRG
ncbi:MAG: hypothetical protein KDC47_11550, partial [Flavobacteriaceae bacterium]|nr:hypothetical protein [Flavobacteriaceae bacterium]